MASRRLNERLAKYNYMYDEEPTATKSSESSEVDGSSVSKARVNGEAVNNNIVDHEHSSNKKDKVSCVNDGEDATHSVTPPPTAAKPTVIANSGTANVSVLTA